MQERHSSWLGPSDLAKGAREQSPIPPQAAPQRPSSSNVPAWNRPLPPSPSTSGNNGRNPSILRGFPRREPPQQLDTTHLRPEPLQHQHYNSNDDSAGYHPHNYSRSMPNSPRNFSDSSNSQGQAMCGRTQSAAFNYPRETPMDHFSEQPYSSTDDYLNMRNPSQSYTYPPLSNGITTTRDHGSTRARPHTWLSPTEPFTDISEFHLFAEAMTGLPNDTESPSANSPPRLQGSLFARRSRNDSIPIPLQYPQENQSSRSHRSDWQNFEPPPVTSSQSVSRPTSAIEQRWQPPPHVQSLTMEIGILGLEVEHDSDDELPNYAQSQAEMSAKKRAEASARARELEARWRNTRGR
ncbi:hypothetical protein NX059_001492 [Plenodomus lindquistii]|nr:hypothetical protein NX059_001492 [Plenodomus lindquistii]